MNSREILLKGIFHCINFHFIIPVDIELDRLVEVQNLIKTKGVRGPHAKQAEQQDIVAESNGFYFGHYPNYPGLT